MAPGAAAVTTLHGPAHSSRWRRAASPAIVAAMRRTSPSTCRSAAPLRRSVSRLALLALACLAPGCATSGEQPVGTTARPQAVLQARTCGAVERLHALGDVHLGSQPSADDLRQAKADGVKTIISLRHAAELKDFDEEAAARALGLEFARIPWNGPLELDDAVFDGARAALRDATRPVFVHCGSGNRVAAVWIPYRVLDQGLDLEAAVAEAKVVGLKTPEFEAKARDYVARRRQGS